MLCCLIFVDKFSIPHYPKARSLREIFVLTFKSQRGLNIRTNISSYENVLTHERKILKHDAKLSVSVISKCMTTGKAIVYDF